MELYILILIFLAHFIGDFILQTDDMAKNKSKDNMALTYHIAMYSLPFIILFGPIYAVINGLLHWVIDFTTSRISSKLYQKGDIHNFFVVIGFDQFLHMTCLVGTYWYLFIN